MAISRPETRDAIESHNDQISEPGQHGFPLPRLIDQRGLIQELGITRAAAEKIMRHVPKVHISGLRKVYVKREDVARMLQEATRL